MLFRRVIVKELCGNGIMACPCEISDREYDFLKQQIKTYLRKNNESEELADYIDIYEGGTYNDKGNLICRCSQCATCYNPTREYYDENFNLVIEADFDIDLAKELKGKESNF